MAVLDPNAPQTQQVSDSSNRFIEDVCLVDSFVRGAASESITFTGSDDMEATVPTLRNIVSSVLGSGSATAAPSEDSINRLAVPMEIASAPGTYSYQFSGVLPTLDELSAHVPSNFAGRSSARVPTSANPIESSLSVVGEVTRNSVVIPAFGFRPSPPPLNTEIVANQTDNSDRMVKINGANTGITYGAKVPSAAQFSELGNLNSFLSSGTNAGTGVRFGLRHGTDTVNYFTQSTNIGKAITLAEFEGTINNVTTTATLGFAPAMPTPTAAPTPAGTSTDSGKFPMVNTLGSGYNLSGYSLPSTVGAIGTGLISDGTNYMHGQVTETLAEDPRLRINSGQNRRFFWSQQVDSTDSDGNPTTVDVSVQSAYVAPADNLLPPVTSGGGIRDTAALFIDRIERSDPTDALSSPTSIHLTAIVGTLPQQSTPGKLGNPLIATTVTRRNNNGDPIDHDGNVLRTNPDGSVIDDDLSASLLYTYDTINYAIPENLGSEGQIPTVTFVPRLDDDGNPVSDSLGNPIIDELLLFQDLPEDLTTDSRFPAVTSIGRIFLSMSNGFFGESPYSMPAAALGNRNALVGEVTVDSSSGTDVTTNSMVDSGISLPVRTGLREGAVLRVGQASGASTPIVQSNLNINSTIPERIENPDGSDNEEELIAVITPGNIIGTTAAQRYATLTYSRIRNLFHYLLDTFTTGSPTSNVDGILIVSNNGIENSSIRMFPRGGDDVGNPAASRNIVIYEQDDNADQLRTINTTLNPVTTDGDRGAIPRVSQTNDIEYVQTVLLPPTTGITQGHVPTVNASGGITYQAQTGGSPGGTGDSSFVGLNQVDNMLSVTTGEGSFNLFEYQQTELVPGVGDVQIVANDFILLSSAATLNFGLTAISSSTANDGAWSSTSNYRQNTIVVYEDNEWLSLTEDNLNNEPTTSPDNWDDIGLGASSGGAENITTQRGDLIIRLNGNITRLPLGNPGENLIVTNGVPGYGTLSETPPYNTIATSAAAASGENDMTQNNANAGFDNLFSVSSPSISPIRRVSGFAVPIAGGFTGKTPVGSRDSIFFISLDVTSSSLGAARLSPPTFRTGVAHKTIKNSEGELKLLSSRAFFHGSPQDYGSLSHTSILQTNLGSIQDESISITNGSSTVTIDQEGIPYFRDLNIRAEVANNLSNTPNNTDLNTWREEAIFRASGFRVVDYRRIFLATGRTDALRAGQYSRILETWADLRIYLTSAGTIFYVIQNFQQFGTTQNLPPGFFQAGLRTTPTEVLGISGVSEIISFDSINGGKEGYMPGIFYRVGPAGTGEIRYMGLNYNGCSGTSSGNQSYVHNLPVLGLPANFANKIYTSCSMDRAPPSLPLGNISSHSVGRAGSYVISGGVIHRAGILPGINSTQTNFSTDTTFVSTAGEFLDNMGNVKLIRSFSIKCPFSAYFVTTDNNLFENACNNANNSFLLTSTTYRPFQGANAFSYHTNALHYVVLPEVTDNVLKVYQTTGHNTVAGGTGVFANYRLTISTAVCFPLIVTLNGEIIHPQGENGPQSIRLNYEGDTPSSTPARLAGITRTVSDLVVGMQSTQLNGLIDNFEPDVLAVYDNGTLSAPYHTGSGNYINTDIRN